MNFIVYLYASTHAFEMHSKLGSLFPMSMKSTTHDLVPVAYSHKQCDKKKTNSISLVHHWKFYMKLTKTFQGNISKLL